MYSLRKAKTGEEEKILKLIKYVLSGYGLEVNPEETDKDLSDLNVFYFDNQGWFAVIEHGDDIIGSYAIFRVNDQVCELRKMYLLPEFHGKGLGNMMMEDALHRAKTLGYTEMILETNTLLEKAIHLYSKYGFMEFNSPHLSDRCNYAMSKKI